MGVTKTNNHPNQDQDCKPQSGTSRILQNPKSEVKGQVCLLHLQNQDTALTISLQKRRKRPTFSG